MKINDDNIISVVIAGSILFLAVLTGSGFVFGSTRFAASILAGGILALANFFWLAAALRRALQLEAAIAGRFALLRYILRLLIMGSAVYVLIIHARADVFGLLLGLSVLVLSITGLALYTMTGKGGW